MIKDLNYLLKIAPRTGSAAYLLAGLTIAIKAKLVLEIGTGKLNSTQAFIHGLNISGGNIISCDPVKRFKEFNHSRFTFVNKTSNELAKTWNKKIDILFIDGDHSYNQVEFDYKTFSPFVVKNGLIIFHDTNDPNIPDVSKFVSEIKEVSKINLTQYQGVTIIQKEGIS